MNEIFVKSLYKTIVEEDKEEYRAEIDNISVDDMCVEYGELFENLTDKRKELLINFREVIIVDTISYMLGIIDGSSTLSGCDAEVKLLLNDKYTDMELQDLFLEYIEERKGN